MIPTGWLAIIALISISAGVLAWHRGRPVESERQDGWRSSTADRTWSDTDRYDWKDGER